MRKRKGSVIPTGAKRSEGLGVPLALTRTPVHAHTLYGVPELNVQLLMFWIAVNPPVPPVKPT
jgi:hypothetical protein